jgi:hypothetical protein
VTCCTTGLLGASPASADGRAEVLIARPGGGRVAPACARRAGSGGAPLPGGVACEAKEVPPGQPGPCAPGSRPRKPSAGPAPAGAHSRRPSPSGACAGRCHPGAVVVRAARRHQGGGGAIGRLHPARARKDFGTLTRRLGDAAAHRVATTAHVYLQAHRLQAAHLRAGRAPIARARPQPTPGGGDYASAPCQIR